MATRLRRMTFVMFALFATALASSANAAAEQEHKSAASFLAAHPAPGIHVVVGYVVGEFRCPSCPPGAQCEPCPPDSIYLGDSVPTRPKTYETRDKSDIIVNVRDPQTLPFGKRFRIRLEVGLHANTGSGLNDLKLIDSQQID